MNHDAEAEIFAKVDNFFFFFFQVKNSHNDTDSMKNANGWSSILGIAW